MKKLLTLLVLIVVAIFAAGVYGIIHDQISFTVSPEYFTKFKFEQFGLLDSPVPNRIKAGIVGFLASWWMGIPIGILVGLMGLMHSGHRRMLQVSLQSFILVVGFTLAIGLAGLGFGYHQTSRIDLADYSRWFIPKNLVHLRRFLCVGYMHNSSYLGGAASILVAGLFHVVVRVRTPSAISKPLAISHE